MNFQFQVDVDVERTTGKFASRDEIEGAIFDALSEAVDSLDLSSVGADGNSEYEITHYNVEETTPAKDSKKLKDQTDPIALAQVRQEKET